MSGQLVLPFGVSSALGHADFIVSGSNKAAYDFVAAWPDWPARAAALHGPEGSGKSHLGLLWCERAGATTIAASKLTADTLAELPAEGHLLVEDMDIGAPAAERDHALFALLERPAGTLLLTARTPPADWGASIPDLTSRFAALLHFAMWAPDDALLGALARKLFADRQLQVPEAVISRMLQALERTPASVAGFVAELDVKSLAERRPVTERLVLDLLDRTAAQGE
jgi:chromosomal replication initiation ATPase DnaA